jgi:hypothetical protein
VQESLLLILLLLLGHLSLLLVLGLDTMSVCLWFDWFLPTVVIQWRVGYGDATVEVTRANTKHNSSLDVAPQSAENGNCSLSQSNHYSLDFKSHLTTRLQFAPQISACCQHQILWCWLFLGLDKQIVIKHNHTVCIKGESLCSHKTKHKSCWESGDLQHPTRFYKYGSSSLVGDTSSSQQQTLPHSQVAPLPLDPYKYI